MQHLQKFWIQSWMGCNKILLGVFFDIFKSPCEGPGYQINPKKCNYCLSYGKYFFPSINWFSHSYCDKSKSLYLLLCIYLSLFCIYYYYCMLMHLSFRSFRRSRWTLFFSNNNKFWWKRHSIFASVKHTRYAYAFQWHAYSNGLSKLTAPCSRPPPPLGPYIFFYIE